MRFSSKPTDAFQTEEMEQSTYKLTLLRYLRYWYIFAICLCLSFGAVYVYLLYATPQYNVTSTLLLKDRKDEQQPDRNERFIAPSTLSEGKNIDNEIVVFKSATLIHRVLTELGLTANYYVQERFRNRELYQADLPLRVVVEKLDSAAKPEPFTVQMRSPTTYALTMPDGAPQQHNFGELVQLPYAIIRIISTGHALTTTNRQPLLIHLPYLPRLAADYARRLVVTTVNKQASILSLSLTDAIPARAQAVIGRLIQVYNQEAVEDKNLEAQHTIAFIDDRLKYLSTDLSSVEKSVERFRRRNNVANVGSQINQSLLETSDYNRQASDYGIQIAVLESLRDYISNPNNQQQLIPGTLNVQDPTLSDLIGKFNAQLLERERLLRTVKEGNPVVDGITAELSKLRSNISESIASARNSLLSTQRSLRARSNQASSNIEKVPTIERGLGQISRQQELKQSLYLYLLQKREEAGLTLAASVSASRIIDPPTASSEPVTPVRSTVFLVALLLGLGLPAAFIYAKDALNDKVQTIDDLKLYTAAPILGEIAHNATSHPIAITKQDRSPTAEMLRLIRTNLHFALPEPGNKVLLITSGRSNEGKTFFCLNLAASLVLAGKNVVVVNLDLRKPKSLLEQGFSNGHGVSNYLSSDSLLADDIIHASPLVPGLCMVSAGPLLPDPAEAIMSSRLAHLLDVLKKSFDYVLLDSAPVGQVADAFSLASYVDATIYVVRYNYTYKAQLDLVNTLVADNRLGPLLLVANDAYKRNLNSHGYGYGYGYQGTKASTV
jgi:tyrosine-protein kinase Etk/Wzc